MTTDKRYVLALDLGTTGNRAILFDRDGEVVAQSYKELKQYYPEPGWLEHDAIEIWQDTLGCAEDVLDEANVSAKEVAAIGLTVQRETCLLWDKNTGRPLHKAIVWQDRRTAPLCNSLRRQGKAELIQERTGLVLDSYFSATKLVWLLDWVRERRPQIDFDN
ncbi:FGGY family carbohydrate kinase, partial [Geitlerinema sp. P-1104]|uniref:FGGY family carbohydrate kinase n=1 Tax=Geitlerinema sp. P-1104 TaxID=2546230 RepID=UPI00256FAAEA